MRQTIVQHYIEEGEKRGEIRAKREAVLKIMRVRFDSIPVSVMKKVNSIRRMDRLDALLEKAAIARGIDEIEMD